MNTAIVLLVANLVAGVANLIGIVRLVRARTPDPVPIAGSATEARDRNLSCASHYVVRRTNGHDEFTLYDGSDSDLAYAAWITMERDPAKHPGYHEYLENGRHRAKRHHSEIAP